MNAFTPSRRAILVGGAAIGAGLVVGFALPAGTAPLSEGDGRLNMWVRVTPEGKAVVRTIATEMGQGAQTGVAQLVAEELEVAWADVSVEFAPVETQFYIRDGVYLTGGSGSIVRFAPDGTRIFDLYRQAGAAARMMLINAAAARWGAAATDCRAEAGRVLHADGRSEAYGALVAEAAKLTPPTEIALKPREAWRVIGKQVSRLDLPDKVTGKAVYGVDVDVPGALVATIAHAPAFGGRLGDVDPAPALAIPGVRHVVALENAVAVVADRFWPALKGLKALAPNFEDAPGVHLGSAEVSARLHANIGAADQMTWKAEDDTLEAVEARHAAAFDGARVIEAVYETPFLSHSPIEPMNATAHVTANGCEIWAPCQHQGGLKDDVAQALEMDPAQITVHTTFVGGGFGRRLQSDYAVLAARISRRVGAPVKLIWTREQDTQHGFYRPASVLKLRAAIAPDGRFRGLETIGATSNDVTLGGLALMRYALDSIVARQKQVDTPFPRGAWRAVDRSQSVFYVECFIDEVAHDLKIDPLAFRRTLLADKPRDLRVLNAAAEMAGWGAPKPGRHLGIAFMSGWGTRLAQVAEVSVDEARRLRVHRVCCAFDPATVVNPDAVKAQVEGGICMGLSAALAEQITVKAGAVEQGLFDSYPILTLAQAPEIDVQLFETPDEEIGGVGEPPLPPIAPAVCNAIFAATGVRIRRLPIVTQGFTVA